MADQAAVGDQEICERLKDLLRRAGYSGLEHVGRQPLKGWIEDFGVWAMAGAFALGVAGAGANRMDLAVWLSIALAAALVGAVILAVNAAEDGPLELFFIGAYFALPAGALAWAILAGAGAVETLSWHVAPIVFVALATLALHRFERAWLRRTLDALTEALSKVPLVFALIGLVVFALVVTTEVWAVAEDEDALRLAVLAALIIIPEFLVLRHVIADKIDGQFAKTAAGIAADEETVDSALRQAARVGSKKDRQWLSDHAKPRLRYAYEDQRSVVLATSFCEELRARLRRQVTLRLAITVLAVGVVAAVSIYLLAAVTVGAAVAQEWADVKAIPEEEVLGVAVPLGPYVNVAALLAIVATAIFLGFAITSDTLPDELAKAFVAELALTVLLLGVPCHVLSGRTLPEQATPPVAAAPAPAGA